MVGVHCTKSTLIPCLEYLKRNSVIVWNKWSCPRIPSTVRHPCISTRIGGPSSESWLNCMIFGLLTTVNTCMSASLESGKLDKYLVITFFQSLNSRVIKKKKKLVTKTLNNHEQLKCFTNAYCVMSTLNSLLTDSSVRWKITATSSWSLPFFTPFGLIYKMDVSLMWRHTVEPRNYGHQWAKKIWPY